MYSSILFVVVDVHQLDKDVSDVVQMAWSSNTLATRNSQWKRFINFCSELGVKPVPSDTKTVGRFLVHLSHSCKYSTIENYLSAIISLHKYYGYVPEFRDSFYITMILRGLKRKLGTMKDQMQPYTIEQLRLMHSTMDVTSPMEETLWTIVITSFRSLLRKSNLVPTANTDSPHVLLRQDVTLHSWGAMLRVRSSKTVQHKQYVLELPIYYVSDKVFCAASAIRKHILYFPAPDTSPLFKKKGPQGFSPVMYQDVLSFIVCHVMSYKIGSFKVRLSFFEEVWCNFHEYA